MSFNAVGNSQQIITVDSSGSSCTVNFYEKSRENWCCLLETNGIVGKNGVSNQSCEGDYRTPSGVYSLGFAFGTQSLNDIDYEYRLINNNCYWVDDPHSPMYNQWVESSNITWNSAEHLIDYPQAYKYAVVINYNMSPVVSGKGSAIFLHCMTGSYTAGCVAIPESSMKHIIKQLDSAKNPIIIIE